MMSEFILMDDNNVKFLIASFPDVEFNLYQALIGECSYLSVFYCSMDNEELLAQLWSRINNLIGTEYQTKIHDEFSSWNIYLAFSIPKKVTNTLKYSVENDTFFMRKIVFDNNIELHHKESISERLNDHILGRDINIETNLNNEAMHKPNYSEITKNLLAMKFPLGRTKSDKDIRDKWLEKTILEVTNHEI